MAKYLVFDSFYRTSDGKWLLYGYYIQTPWVQWKGESIDKDPFDALLPTYSQANNRYVYITLRCWNTLSDHNKAVARGRAQGVTTQIGTPQKANIMECFNDQCKELCGITPDPCEGVSCPDKCVGVDKYNQVCDDGICVRGTLIETNSVHCGYTPEPEPDPTPTPTSDTYIIVGLVLAGTYIILRR